MAIAVRFLEQEQQQPGDVAGACADFLAAAQSSLHLAMYNFCLNDPLATPMVHALRNRVTAGVQVRIAYDAGKPHVSFQRECADPAPPGTAQFVRRIADGMATKAITGGDMHMPKLMHHKYIIRDGRT